MTTSKVPGCRWRGVLLSVFLVVSMPSCGVEPMDPPQVGTEEEAAAWVDSWLRAAAGDVGDRGWSLLHPATRSNLYQETADRYQADVAGSDWQFDWQVGPSRFADGEYHVELLVVGGADSLPGFLVDRGLVQAVEAEDRVRLVVVIELEADRSKGGVLAVGGNR